MLEALRIFGIASLAAIAPLVIALAPEAEGDVVIIASPFAAQGAMGVLAQADGRLVAATRLASVVIARSEAPDFSARLLRSGALMVLNARLAGGCTDRTGPAQ